MIIKPHVHVCWHLNISLLFKIFSSNFPKVMYRHNLSMEKQRQRHTNQAMAYIVYKQNAKTRCLCYSTHRGAFSQSFLNSEGHASGAPAAPHPSAGGWIEAPHRFTLPSNCSAGFLTMMSAHELMQQGQPWLREKAGGSTGKFCSRKTLGLCEKA